LSIAPNAAGKVFLCVVALAGAFAFGRYSAAEPDVVAVESDHATETQVRTAYSFRDRVENRTRVVYRETVTKPDGTKIEREAEHETERVEDRAGATTVETLARESTHNATTKTTSDRPTLRVGLLAGVAVAAAPLSFSPTVGAHASYRFLGPLSAGIWGTMNTNLSGGAAGLSLSLEF
jgi:hypothetical protein